MQLREKLRLALPAAPSPGTPAPPHLRPGPFSPTHAAPHAALPVERLETELGEVYVARERWPLGYRHGHLALADALAVGQTALARLAPGLGPEDLERAAFVDIETTGLAGGTGTPAFLVGVGTFEGSGLCLRQFFLARLGGEAAMLAAVSRVLAGCRAVVTFNGRCFDLPVLESRFVLSRLRPVFGGLPHVDLLHPARRLYARRLGSCRLGALEEAVLGVRRERDIPGWAVPRLYFDYVRYGAARPLLDVFRHNRLDVLSLVTLLARIGQAAGAGAPNDAEHCLALARWDETRGRLEQAATLYRSALDAGVQVQSQALARRRLARILRRLGRWRELEGLLTETLHSRVAAGWRLEALVELAKLQEHRLRDFPAAEGLTRQASALLDVMAVRGDVAPASRIAARADLERRLLRLRRRQGAVRGRQALPATSRSP